MAQITELVLGQINLFHVWVLAQKQAKINFDHQVPRQVNHPQRGSIIQHRLRNSSQFIAVLYIDCEQVYLNIERTVTVM